MKKIAKNIEKNLITGVVATAILGSFIIIFKLPLTEIKKIWNQIYHLFPWQFQNKYLEFAAFLISTLLIIWLLGVIVNVTYFSKFRFQKIVNGFLKYKTAVLWEVPIINTIHYGVVTKRNKIIKKFPDNREEQQERVTVFFPTVPLIATGNVTKPDPKDLWIITNITTISQIISFFATAGADEPDEIIAVPFLSRYPECGIKIKT